MDVFSGDAERGGMAKADAEHNGVKSLLQCGERNVPSEFNTRPDCDAEALNHAGFFECDFNRLAQSDNAVGGEPAGHLTLLEDRDSVAEQGQLSGAGESGGAGADDGDGAAGGRGFHWWDRRRLAWA